MKMKQQGDLTFRLVNCPPKGASRLNTEGRIILAEGEATGHAHAILEVGGCEAYEHDGTMFLRVSGPPAEVHHQEHATVTLEPGVWEVERVREYDYLEEVSRKVRD